MPERRIGVIGATSLVGQCLLPVLTAEGCCVIGFSRSAGQQAIPNVEWRRLPVPPSDRNEDQSVIGEWICVAPILVLSDYFPLLESYGVKRVVVLSSTSIFTKIESSNRMERMVAESLAEAEKRLQQWAQNVGAEWVILRPTLIYGRGKDKNISQIAMFIRRFGFFPVLGKANGGRQPVHCEDVAAVCARALDTPVAANQAFNLSGGDNLTYRDMVSRIFAALGRTPCLLIVPMTLFKVGMAFLRCFPRYRHLSPAMVERMNIDLVFDHSEATRLLGFDPRPFSLDSEDLPGR